MVPRSHRRCRSQARRLSSAGFFFDLAAAATRPLGPLFIRRHRWDGARKSGGPTLFELSLKVQRDFEHNPPSGFEVLPGTGLNAQIPLKVLRRSPRGISPDAHDDANDRPANTVVGGPDPSSGLELGGNGGRNEGLPPSTALAPFAHPSVGGPRGRRREREEASSRLLTSFLEEVFYSFGRTSKNQREPQKISGLRHVRRNLVRRNLSHGFLKCDSASDQAGVADCIFCRGLFRFRFLWGDSGVTHWKPPQILARHHRRRLLHSTTTVAFPGTTTKRTS